MSRSIFAHADGVVGENVNVRQLRKRGEPDRSSAIIGKDHESGARGAENSMVGNSIHDRAHPVFADAEMNVAALWRFAGEIAAVLDVIQCRSV